MQGGVELDLGGLALLGSNQALQPPKQALAKLSRLLGVYRKLFQRLKTSAPPQLSGDLAQDPGTGQSEQLNVETAILLALPTAGAAHRDDGEDRGLPGDILLPSLLQERYGQQALAFQEFQSHLSITRFKEMQG
jgi:hypothetical protein